MYRILQKQKFTKSKLIAISVIALFLLTTGIQSASAGITTTILADFDSGNLPAGFVGFADSWDGSGSTTTLALAVVPNDYPGSSGNLALQVDFDVAASGSWGGGPGYAGITHDFAAAQDWSSDEGFYFWFAGSNTGTDLRVELKSDGTDPVNSNRYEFTFSDDSTDWKQITIPWSSFTQRIDYNPGPSPSDPINLSTMWGYSILIPGGAVGTFTIDEFAIYRNDDVNEEVLIDDFESGLPNGVDSNGISIGFVTFYDPSSSVAISTTDAPPVPVPNSAVPNNVLRMDVDVTSYAGFVHNFENESVDTWVSQDWSAFEGISFWLYGNNSGTTMFVDVLDDRNPDSTTDDAERWSIDVIDDFNGWQEIKIAFADMHRKEIGNGAPNDGFGLTEVYGWALGTITTPAPLTYYIDNVKLYGVAPERPLTVGFSAINYEVVEGATATLTAKLSKPVSNPVKVQFTTDISTAVPDRDFIPSSGTLTFLPNTTLQSFTIQTIDDQKYQGELGVVVILSEPTGGAGLGLPPVARLTIRDNESYDPILLDDFEDYPYAWAADSKTSFSILEIPVGDSLALPGQGEYEKVFQIAQLKGKGTYNFSRTFPIPQDWSASDGLNFWYYGRSSGKDVQISLTNTEAFNDEPSKWKLVWEDDFDGAVGTAVDSNVWGQEIGDGTVNGIPGWGNDELEYYSAGTANASTDGMGNLQITAKQADGSLMCYYGPCEYTSARLLTKDRFEVAFGRVEARIKVPEGAGLWPAFWMLGTDIDEVSWPQSGEIDIMEFVGRVPNEIFGTLHGPGYSGGQSYGGYYDVGEPVGDQFHVFAVEWQLDQITWFIDDIPYFTATSNDPFMQDKQWVFNHPFFILLNVAVGGNFGGAVGEDTIFPQSMLVDYVRLYQAKTKSTEFKAYFKEDFSGWQKVSVPFTAFTNEDGYILNTTNIQTLGFMIPEGLSTPVMLDQIRLSCPSEVTVTNTADSGPGSLRQALSVVCSDGTITFSPELDGQTITLLSGPLTLGKNITIDGSNIPGLTLSGNFTDRVFIVNTGTTATLKNITVANGFGWQLAGGILNNGALTLEQVIVTNNIMATDAGDYWQGGGGIYNGDGAVLNLINSTVSNNQAGWSGGGIYSFFNTTTSIIGSTISGNISNDVGGGIRSLGNMTITNSTISGNTATGWHGGAIFMTDGDIAIINSTIANNIAPDYSPSAIFIGQFGGSFVPTLSLVNTIITGNQWYACEKFASGVVGNVVSGGHNLIQDDSCNPTSSDQIGLDALIGYLNDNGGPTLTHSLLPGSPAIDAADNAFCPETDQRGVARPQGEYCDIGAFEYYAP